MVQPLVTPDYYTNAKTAGIDIDQAAAKALLRRSNKQALVYLAKWALAWGLAASLVYVSAAGQWQWLALLVLGTVITVPAYALSHEAAHGTVFRTRRANKLLFWFTSFIYMEEPLHRYHTHTNHHAYTWHTNIDSQMPFATPMGFWGWLQEMSSIGLLRFHVRTMFQLVLGRPALIVQQVTPAKDLPKMIRNARLLLLAYLLLAYAIVGLGQEWLWWYLVLPRLLGAPVMLLFTMIQHVEMQEDAPSVVDSSRSFVSNWIVEFLYCNMNYHIEHHLYPMVPFYNLPKLSALIADQLPEPDPGFWRTNLEVLLLVVKRSLGLYTKAPSIRQAPHMITRGKVKKISGAMM